MTFYIVYQSFQKGIQCPLHTLLLSYNTVGNEGAKALADVRKHNEHAHAHSVWQFVHHLSPLFKAVWRILYLRCYLKKEGCLILPFRKQVIQSSSVLKRLSLKNNGIQEGGLIVLALALSSNETVESIELFGNEFSDGTGQIFHEMKCQFSSKLSLDLSVYIVDGHFQTAEVGI